METTVHPDEISRVASSRHFSAVISFWGQSFTSDSAALSDTCFLIYRRKLCRSPSSRRKRKPQYTPSRSIPAPPHVKKLPIQEHLAHSQRNADSRVQPGFGTRSGRAPNGFLSVLPVLFPHGAPAFRLFPAFLPAKSAGAHQILQSAAAFDSQKGCRRNPAQHAVLYRSGALQKAELCTNMPWYA